MFLSLYSMVFSLLFLLRMVIIKKKIQIFFFNFPASVLPFEFDIALLRLDEPVELLDSVSTICLHDIQHKDTEIYCSVSGWGQLSEGD